MCTAKGLLFATLGLSSLGAVLGAQSPPVRGQLTRRETGNTKTEHSGHGDHLPATAAVSQKQIQTFVGTSNHHMPGDVQVGRSSLVHAVRDLVHEGTWQSDTKDEPNSFMKRMFTVSSSKAKSELRSQVQGVFPKQEFLDPVIVSELRCVHCIMTSAHRDYVITEGTLMGAARNGFLLPWDADGDFLFDARGGDYESFYKLFSPGPNSTASKQCPSTCQAMQVNLFIGPDTKIDGVAMHFWQGYDDLKSGSLVERATGERRQADEDTHKRLLGFLKNPNPARLHYNSSWFIRAGGVGYLDVAPYELYADTGPKTKVPAVALYNDATVGRNATKVILGGPHPVQLNVDSLLPINKHCMVKNFGANGVETLELSCQSKPEDYLQARYGKDWLKEPYNKYDDDASTWVHDEHSSSLEHFLVQKEKERESGEEKTASDKITKES